MPNYPPPHSDEAYIVETVQQFRAGVRNAIVMHKDQWTSVLNLDGHVYLLTWDARVSPEIAIDE